MANFTPPPQITATLALCTTLFATGAMANQPQIYGLHEKVSLYELALELPAKLDTGAETASLSAKNIQVFKRDGGEWVRFQLGMKDAKQAQVIEKPLARMSYIKRRADDRKPGDKQLYSARPVIEMDICVGNELKNIEVNLTDRSAFEYPLLIGSSALKEFNAAVSPGVRYSAGQPSCTQTS
ncbi:ATP-dependent zinc protease family protein [Pseudomonas anguilliseptica]|uniref:ATP-dependent zinc protease family protein n=1 Tax=Pseudomonas anguilliseptica TaxID=53406 RepID=UPI003735F976